jgi:hypothetical protein
MQLTRNQYESIDEIKHQEKKKIKIGQITHNDDHSPITRQFISCTIKILTSNTVTYYSTLLN